MPTSTIWKFALISLRKSPFVSVDVRWSLVPDEPKERLRRRLREFFWKGKMKLWNRRRENKILEKRKKRL